MNTSNPSYRRCRLQPSPVVWILVWCFASALALKADDLGSTNAIFKAETVRDLTVTQAGRHYPVQLQGVITFFDTNLFMRFIQDDTAGIYFFPYSATNEPVLAAGQLVELDGTTDPGEFAPVVHPSRITVLGAGTFPPAKLVSYEQLASGEQDSQFVEIHGIVHAVAFDPQTKYYSVEIETGCGRVTALVGQLPVANMDLLVDSTVQVRGVCATSFTLRRQLFNVRLLVPRPADLAIESPAPARPFAATPLRPISQLLQFAPHSPLGHRVKVAGTVIYAQDDTIYIENKTDGLCVQTSDAGSLLPGDQVEVLGFPAKGEYSPMLKDATFRKIGSSPAVPVPQTITVADALKGTYDCQLVRIQARILDRARLSPDEFLVLQSDGFIFLAYRERRTSGVDFAYLPNGATVAVTGVCRIEVGNEWRVGTGWRANSFNLLVRGPRDTEVISQPSP
ncbi:MAG TPA: hypothetical protein VMA35_08155 [Candidatus Sulfopaludibacter sp.]|nr:hypothetical protein [Candidatus Sulfopaludibacter sp.]